MPVAIVFMIIQPIMFVILFRYIFGGVIHIPGVPYVNYLIPGILVQTTMFGSVGTAIGLAEDLQKGLIERFRALPMARLAVLAGRTVSDLFRNVIVIVIITGVGFLVGFRPRRRSFAYLQACLLMLIFAYCLSWGFAFVGLSAPNSEAAQAMTFPAHLSPRPSPQRSSCPCTPCRAGCALRQQPAGQPDCDRGARSDARRAPRRSRRGSRSPGQSGPSSCSLPSP